MSKFNTRALFIALFLGWASLAIAQGSSTEALELETGSEFAISSLSTVVKLKNMALALLFNIMIPIAGAWLFFSGIKAIGNSQRGDKGPGVIMIIAAVCMFLIPLIVPEILKLGGN